MVTMHDIAEAAGVSSMTVSNVINGRTTKVSQATIQRVLHLVESMGYVPNAQARALAANKSGIVALLFPVIPDVPPLGGPHDGAFIAAAAEALCEARLHVMIHAAVSPARTRTWLRTWKVDGVIVIGPAPESDEEPQGDMPFVWLDAPQFASDADAREQATTAVNHLLHSLA